MSGYTELEITSCFLTSHMELYLKGAPFAPYLVGNMEALNLGIMTSIVPTFYDANITFAQ